MLNKHSHSPPFWRQEWLASHDLLEERSELVKLLRKLQERRPGSVTPFFDVFVGFVWGRGCLCLLCFLHTGCLFCSPAPFVLYLLRLSLHFSLLWHPRNATTTGCFWEAAGSPPWNCHHHVSFKWFGGGEASEYLVGPWYGSTPAQKVNMNLRDKWPNGIASSVWFQQGHV